MPMMLGDACMIEGHQNFPLCTINDNLKTAIGSGETVDGLSKAQCSLGGFFSRFLMWPAVVWYEHLHHQLHRTWGRLEMHERGMGRRWRARGLELPLSRVGNGQVVFFDAQQIFQRIPYPAVVAVSSIRYPARSSNRFQLAYQIVLIKDNNRIILHTPEVEPASCAALFFLEPWRSTQDKYRCRYNGGQS